MGIGGLKMQDKNYLYKLTPAEEKIYQLIMEGYGQTALIKLTQKSAGTIKAQMTAIFQKKGVHSVKELRSLED